MSAVRMPSTSDGHAAGRQHAASSSTCPSAAGPTRRRSACRSAGAAPASDHRAGPTPAGAPVHGGQRPSDRCAAAWPDCTARAGRGPGRRGCLLLLASPAHAYIGPGAGFAVLSSFLVVLVTTCWSWWRRCWPGRSARCGALVRRHRAAAVVDRPADRRRLRRPGSRCSPIASWPKGLLPNFARLAATGCYRRLQTTYPALSPVAWSSFSTGTHPARHNIFDFLDRDRRTYLPLLSSTRIGKVERFFRLGKYRIPRHRPELRLPAALEAVLDDARRAPDLEHHPARADHVSARSLLRRRAERDVRARPARHAGHVPAVHDAAGRASASRKAASASRSTVRRRSRRRR